MATSLAELIDEMTTRPTPKITLAWEVLPALDGTLHAVDPDPDAYVDMPVGHPQFSVSLCGKTLQVKDGVVIDSNTCGVCLEISGERQREFDAEARA